MTVALQNNDKSVSSNRSDDFKALDVEGLQLVKQVLAPSLTDKELELFGKICNDKRLCPFQKQIYAIKRGGRMTILTAIDGFRLIAERSGKYAPGRDTEFLYDKSGCLIGAKVFVKKLVAETWHEVSATAFLCEYSTGQNLWTRMPHVMIEKCAEARALRRAFPAELSGLYASEEMEQADVEVTQEPQTQPELQHEHISEPEWNALDTYLNGNEDLRNKLKALCRTTDLSKITKPQLEACRRYAVQYIKAAANDPDSATN